MRKVIEKGRATVFFSATMLPVNYYKELLGEKEDYAVYIDSPFKKENRLIMIARDVSSKYTRRTEKEYKKIAEYIETAIKVKKEKCFEIVYTSNM